MTSTDRLVQSTCLFEISLGVHMHNFLLKMKSSYEKWLKTSFECSFRLFS